MRGKTFSIGDATAIVSYHPSALLRSPGLKKDAWIDLQRLRDMMGISTD
jgi:uracil-DNA glycosylase